MTMIEFGATPPLPKKCPTCKRPQFHWNGEKWQCVNCANPNPCVTKYGPGPKGAECKDCTHLTSYRQSARWYKCDLRIATHGAATDHRVHWPACARFAPENLHEGD